MTRSRKDLVRAILGGRIRVLNRSVQRNFGDQKQTRSRVRDCLGPRVARYYNVGSESLDIREGRKESSHARDAAFGGMAGKECKITACARSIRYVA
jgi:hypothetical protein